MGHHITHMGAFTEKLWVQQALITITGVENVKVILLCVIVKLKSCTLA